MKFKTRLIKEHVLDPACATANEFCTIVKVYPWVTDAKCETLSIIFKHNDRFFKVSDRRTGSHFTSFQYESRDWDDEIECEEYEEIEMVKRIWRKKHA